MTKDEALRLALDYLERHAIIDGIPARDAIREVLAEPNAEYERGFDDGFILRKEKDSKHEWVGLTMDELQPIADEYRILFGSWVEDFARAIEIKLKEKNT
jgi:hypothetical protein